MNMVEVNPRLFITCRLCLEDLGVYQIVPAVKEQISYCFDIQVEPFDGLPQLICKKCETILSNYSETKKKFVEKQNDLKSKIQGSHTDQLSPAQPQLTDSIENLEFKSIKRNLCRPIKRKACISSSSSDLEYGANFKTYRNEKENHRNDYEETSESWPASYTKQYVCRVCNSRWLNIKLLKNHFNSKHSTFNKKYSHIFKRHCEVKLHKTDGKPNVTGFKSHVMHRKEKIIMNVNPIYYIIYTTKDYKDDETYNSPHNEVRNECEKKTKREDYGSSDSSEEDIVFKGKRKRRLLSKSSNDTVVLDTVNKVNMSDNDNEPQNSGKIQTPQELGECINIDDSSDSDSSENGENAMRKMTEQISEINTEDLKVDQTIINDVITTCQNKYMKKQYHDNFLMKASKNPSEIAVQLKRKILSIGRKVINKKLGINCTPLLRFMEHKNLDITWLPREVLYVNQDSNYVRIMTRMKNIGDNCDYEAGWTDNTPSPIQTYEHLVSQSNLNNVSNLIDILELPCAEIPEIALTENAVLVSDGNLTTDTKKLLNANPVANPKQLPKKSVVKQVPNIEVTSQENNDAEFCMPVITSTTSLAAPLLIQQNKDAHNYVPETTSSKNDEQKTDAPRIKVKHVSELMSVETLSRMQEPPMPVIVNSVQPMASQNENNVINMYAPQMNIVPHFQNVLQPNNVTMNLIAPEPAYQNEFIILDSIDMPNTKTNSPFLYLKKLLQLYNIVLLDTYAELSAEFKCLLKFKVLYKQNNKNQPVVLCIALFCAKNVFCIKVKDKNQDNIDFAKVSPNWQWEVIKIYRGEVLIGKVIRNAQKIGQDVYENTNRFLCLLKSINLNQIM